MLRTSLIALTLLTTAALPVAEAQDSIILRSNLTVSDAEIRLGDLFDIYGPEADIVVARAPAPGQRTSLDVNYVRQLAARNGLEWANATQLRRLSIERESRIYTADIITDMLARELQAQFGTRFMVQLTNSQLTLHAPTDSMGGPELANLNYDTMSRMLTAQIRPYGGAQPVRVTARAYEAIEVPVLARPFSAEEIVEAGDIDWIAVRGDRLRPDAILDPQDMIGRQARRALRPNEVVRAYDLQAPVMISRGEIVNLTFTSPGIALSVRARALDNSATGEMGRFVNLQSNRTVEAWVEGPGEATVSLATTQAF